MSYNYVGDIMKKLIFSFIIFFGCIILVNAKSINVKFDSCIDGDTAKFLYKKEVITARFLAIDTPETKHPTKGVEPYGKEASEYTCNKLKNAKKIVLEFDKESDEKDKYDRYLVWVFVDDNLLQKELIENGLASVAYLYGDYKYTNELEEAEQIAEDEKIGIWSIDQTEENKKNESKNEKEKTNINYKEIIILVGVVVIVYIFSKKSRKKINNETKKILKKELKKRLK